MRGLLRSAGHLVSARRGLVFAILLAAITSPGCSDSNKRHENAERARIIRPGELIRLFRAQTGYDLVDQRSPPLPGIPVVHRLGLPGDKTHDAPRELVERYGYFSIFVYQSGREARQSLVGTAPDEQGVYWTEHVVERGSHAGEVDVSAEKFYAQNLVLSWTAKDHRLDRRWTRLDKLLNAIASEGG
jgi:hypothetical protein